MNKLPMVIVDICNGHRQCVDRIYDFLEGDCVRCIEEIKNMCLDKLGMAEPENSVGPAVKGSARTRVYLYHSLRACGNAKCDVYDCKHKGIHAERKQCDERCEFSDSICWLRAIGNNHQQNL